MAIHGITWLYMAIHGNTSLYIAIHGITWLYMTLHGYTWHYMAIHGYTWLYMAIHGYSWLICRGKTTSFSSEPARWSCDNCQRVSDFDSCQFILIRMAYVTDRPVSIFEQAVMWHLTSGYMQWVYGGRRSYATSWQNFLGWIVYQIFLWCSAACTLRARAPLIYLVL